jgi:hypothetical protein
MWGAMIEGYTFVSEGNNSHGYGKYKRKICAFL